MAEADLTCKARRVNGDPNKIICVCDSKSCGDLKFEWPQKSGEVLLVQSSRAGHRFNISHLIDHQMFKDSKRDRVNSIHIDLNNEHQSILGWGGAFTDSFGMNLRNLSEPVANQLIESYFGKDGLQYNFGRVPIGGTDFSPRAYSYDDSDKTDFKLNHWALADEDTKFKIPFIKKATEIAGRSGVKLKFFASPWSPPKWMKTSNSFIRGSLIDDDQIYKSYTNYLMKFYDTYEKQGIKFWGATVQNEPIAAYLPIYFFNSLQFGNEQMINFISNYLGPALEARGWTKDNFKLMVGDDSLGFINYQVSNIMANKVVQKYVTGIAFHWYTSGSVVPYNALTKVYESIKDKIEFMMMSEACAGSQPFSKKVDLGSWDRGESYASDIIEDLVRHTGAWIDWNMALNLEGGPNWAGNFVDSPILVNGEKNEFYKQPMYYALAHFSRFFKPGSIRVESKVTTNKINLFKSLMCVAVHNKETGHLIINILNKSVHPNKVEVLLELSSSNTSTLLLNTFVIDGKSINSVIMKL